VFLTESRGATLTHALAVLCLVIGMSFVWRSFYAMRITTTPESA
jgi:hypothetical protein